MRSHLLLLALGLGLVAGSAAAQKAKPQTGFRAVPMAAVDATIQVPVGWTVNAPNEAVTQLSRPGREAFIVVQALDASTPMAAKQELSLALASMELDESRFSEVADPSLKGALVFSGSVRGADGQPRSYYGIVRLSGFGGGIAVWALGQLDEQDWRDVAGIMRRVTFKKPRPAKLETHRVLWPGIGVIVEVPARGFAVQTQKESALVLAAIKPLRMLSVNLVRGMGSDAHGIVWNSLAGDGVAQPEVRDLPGGGAYGVSRGAVVRQGQRYDAIHYVRYLKDGVGYRGTYLVRFDMDEEQLRRGVELIASMRAKPEPKSQAARAAEAQLKGKDLRAGLGTSSNSMGYSGSASRSEKWTFCSDGSYAYDFKSVISLGQYGGSVKEDRHSGGWVVVDGNDSGLLLLLRPKDRGQLRLPLKVQRNGIFIDGEGFRFGASGRCS